MMRVKGMYVRGYVAVKKPRPRQAINVETTDEGLAIGIFVPRWLGGWRESIPWADVLGVEVEETSRVSGARVVALGIVGLLAKKHEAIVTVQRRLAEDEDGDALPGFLVIAVPQDMAARIVDYVTERRITEYRERHRAGE